MQLCTITREEIQISPAFSALYPSLKAEHLWDIYRALQKIVTGYEAYTDECRRVIEFLYAIGANGTWKNEACDALLVTGITNPKWKRPFPATKFLFALENFGFTIDSIVTVSGESVPAESKKKLKTKDIGQFRIRYTEPDLPHVMLGLKTFAEVCVQIKGDPFYAADVRVLNGDSTKKYMAPIQEIFSILPEEQKNAACMLHKKLEALGCRHNLEREYMLRYDHPKGKGKNFATIYLKNQFWFPEAGNGQDLSFKLNLRHIGEYIPLLEQCTPYIQNTVIGTTACYGCNKQCGGISFRFQGNMHVKCPTYIFRFTDIGEQSMADYMRLLDAENAYLTGKEKTTWKN